jgi:DNA-binding response OmpR family regulator
VLSAEHGEQALEMLTSLTPDLICLDYHLPGIQGIPLVEAIRESAAAASPIILVTALLRVPRELRETVQAVVKKPFNIANLFETIEGLLSQQSGGSKISE